MLGNWVFRKILTWATKKIPINRVFEEECSQN